MDQHPTQCNNLTSLLFSWDSQPAGGTRFYFLSSSRNDVTKGGCHGRKGLPLGSLSNGNF